MHQLIDAKVLAQPTPDGYEALVPFSAVLMPWATGATKRKRVDGPGSDAASSAKAVAADEDDDDEDDGLW